MMKSLTLISCFSIFCLIQSAFGWWDHGHQLIPAIVKLRAMENKSGAVPLFQIKRVEHLLRLWQAVGGLPVHHRWAVQFPFGATIPDYAKLSSEPEKNGFDRSIADGIKDEVHYYNMVVDFNNPVGYPKGCEDKTKPCGSGKFEGVTGQLAFLNETLTRFGDRDPHNPYSFTLDTYLMQFYQFFHFMGDVHQPFHMASLKGGKLNEPPYDMGGNSIIISDQSENSLLKDLFPKIKPYEKYVGLHQLWDSMIWHKETDDLNSQPPRVRRCINYCETYSQDLEHNQLYKDAYEIMNNHDCSKFDVKASFFQMGDESYEYARDFAYKPVKLEHISGDNPKKLDLTDEYIRESHDKIIEFIAKAACRLEYQLHLIFEKMPYLSLIEDLNVYWRRFIKNDELRIIPVMP